MILDFKRIKKEFMRVKSIERSPASITPQIRRLKKNSNLDYSISKPILFLSSSSWKARQGVSIRRKKEIDFK